MADHNSLDLVELNGEPCLRIVDYDHMKPFFMSIVSNDDHWMFISSNGGLSAGRRNAQFALFPYYTDDKLTEMADITGSKSIFQVKKNDKIHIWEPFSSRYTGVYKFKRNLYKSIYGNKIIFEESNLDLQLTFQYSWSSSKKFGFVKTASLVNTSMDTLEITLVDGMQNVMPSGVNSDLQRASSNLVDAYKRSELHKPSGLGIFALSAIIVDKAEPSEALKANTIWSTGFKNPEYLLSSQQLDKFRSGHQVDGELDVKGEKGAYFITEAISLKSRQSKQWKIVADVNKNHSKVFALINSILHEADLDQQVENDIVQGTDQLKSLVAAADGFQSTSDYLVDCRHYSNVLFNIMRGGIFDNHFELQLSDVSEYLHNANQEVYNNHQQRLAQFPEKTTLQELQAVVNQIDDPDFTRLITEYLPLKFSRRHGDPSRPWNVFSINIRDDKSGEKILDYEGNWRDIFQNWEALAYSYPEYIDGMIFKFLNSSTFDGYNPYRVTKGGFDWETIEPDDPWSYIGYWGDHQIIYLQKFLEIIEDFQPSKLASYLDQECFVYAAVPYRIKSYDDIVQNPKDTIDFDHQWDSQIRKDRDQLGADGALLKDSNGTIYHVNLMEKLLATLLSKISNLIPGAGIWMNTQRPEWNDANNALVGNGVSMVTLYYLRRYVRFLQDIFKSYEENQIKISQEMVEFYHSMRYTLDSNRSVLSNGLNDQSRKDIMDALGKAASDYRTHIYKAGFWGKKRSVSLEGIQYFTELCLEYIEHAISHNIRPDKMYHAYNLVSLTAEKASIQHLSEMLEGQVAVLSSGYLNPEEALKVLDAMKSSRLFRKDQYSYLLYPDKELLGFLDKNIVSGSLVQNSNLLQKLLADENLEVIEKDVLGQFHFNGNFKNANDLKGALRALPEEYQSLVGDEEKLVLDIFEQVFNHKAFTGRSGTFYAFEGLGSIYWHMVSKLALAIQENCIRAIDSQQPDEIIGGLLDHYYEVQAGIGVHKSPQLYGAFPTDPYSHTPKHRGAQQPGMTGQVKEDIISRIHEEGIRVKEGKLEFSPVLLRKNEFLQGPQAAEYIDLDQKIHRITLQSGQLLFTYAQVPIIYSLGQKGQIEIEYSNGEKKKTEGYILDAKNSQHIFSRSGEITMLKIEIDPSILK